MSHMSIYLSIFLVPGRFLALFSHSNIPFPIAIRILLRLVLHLSVCIWKTRRHGGPQVQVRAVQSREQGSSLAFQPHHLPCLPLHHKKCPTNHALLFRLLSSPMSRLDTRESRTPSMSCWACKQAVPVGPKSPVSVEGPVVIESRG